MASIINVKESVFIKKINDMNVVVETKEYEVLLPDSTIVNVTVGDVWKINDVYMGKDTFDNYIDDILMSSWTEVLIDYEIGPDE